MSPSQYAGLREEIDIDNNITSSDSTFKIFTTPTKEYELLTKGYMRV